MLKSKLFWPLVAVGALLVVFLGTIFYRPLFIEDETRYAEIAREMLVNNDFVSPTLNNLDYFEKPIMGHWLNAIAMSVFGENGYSVRFFPALGTVLAALLLFLLVKKETKNFEQAMITGLLFATTGLVYAVGTYAVLDAMFSFFTMLAFTAFYWAFTTKKIAHKLTWQTVAGLALGGAFLVKGFVGIVLIGLPAAGFLLWQRDWKQLFLAAWWPLILGTLVVLPWAMAIHKASPDFWRYFIWEEHIGRFMTEDSGQHPEPFWYFLMLLPVLALPWTILWPAAWCGFAKEWKKAFETPLMRFSACAVVLPFLFLSACSGKLATYILPCMPFLLIIITAGVFRYAAKKSTKLIDVTAFYFSYVLMFILIVFVIYQSICFVHLLPPKFVLYAANEKIQFAVAVVALTVLMRLFKEVPRITDIYRKLLTLVLAVLPLMLAAQFIIPYRAVKPLMIEAAYEKYKDRISPETTVAAFRETVGGVCFILKRADIIVYDRKGEMEYGLDLPSGAGRFLTAGDFAEFVRNNPDQPIVLLLNNAKRMAKTPASPVKIWDGNYLYQEYNHD